MRVLLSALAATAIGFAAAPVQAQNFQGGIAAPPVLLQSTGLSKDSGAQRRIRNEVKALRDEARLIMAQNGGVLPEPERLRLQARYNELRKSFRRAG
jgi:hypothetical protein